MNLIKIHDNIAFLENNGRISSLLVKDNNGCTFEEILDKEREILDREDELNSLNAEVFSLEEDIKKAQINDKCLKNIFKYFILFALTIIIMMTIASISFFGSLLTTKIWINLIRLFIVGILTFFEIRAIILSIRVRKNMKLNTNYAKDKEDELSEVNDLLKTKSNELSKIISEINYHKYSELEDITKVLNSAFNETESNDCDSTLNNDLGNTINLDGPTRERIR